MLFHDHMTFLIAMGIFLSIALFAHGVSAVYDLLLDPEARRVKRRLRTWSTRQSDLQSLKLMRTQVLSELPWLNKLLGRMLWVSPLRRLMDKADVRTPVGVYLALAALLGTTAFFLATLGGIHILARLGIGFVAAGVPFFYLYWRKNQRIAQFERQFPQALDLMARAMRAGHGFLVGMKMVSEEFPDPIGREFDKVVEEVNFGIDLPEAFKNLSDRINSQDLKFFVTSIVVQRETGGNLAEILDSLSRLIRNRFELQARVRSLSAQGRMSALVLEALPFVAGVAIYFQAPDYLRLLATDPLGRIMVMVAALLLVFGVLIMRKMVAIRV
jgi:tight adherence protein B